MEIGIGSFGNDDFIDVTTYKFDLGLDTSSVETENWSQAHNERPCFT